MKSNEMTYFGSTGKISRILWEGHHICDECRTVILGESHYGDENNSNDKIGEEVPYSTESVVQGYLDSRSSGTNRKRWYRFFDNIAASFGFLQENSPEFYEKVWFGNYVPILCGVKEENRAGQYIKKHRTEYNDALFRFINENDIQTVVCFSKLVYWNLPGGVDGEESKDILLSSSGERTNAIHVFGYHAGIAHTHCNVELKRPLAVYGIRHPSSNWKYDPQKVYDNLSEQPELKGICWEKK